MRRGRGRPRRRPDKLHGDKGYDHRFCGAECRRRGVKHRIARRGVESGARPGRHRWLVERTLAWLARFRRLIVRYERRADIHLAFTTPGQHAALGSRFGRLHIHPNAPQLIEGRPEILVIKADENSKRVAGELWHSDVSCDEEPPMGSILHIHEVPANGGGDTMFANMYAAYDALSAPTQHLLERCTAMHESIKAHTPRHRTYRADGHYPEAEHPVVRTHSDTGGKALFVNRGFTTRIVQLSDSESDAVLEMLFRHIETPTFHCRFKWQPDSVAFWDNRAAQHNAIWDYHSTRRYGHRITVCGDRPFFRA